jgi:hypothetical protein
MANNDDDNNIYDQKIPESRDKAKYQILPPRLAPHTQHLSIDNNSKHNTELGIARPGCHHVFRQPNLTCFTPSDHLVATWNVLLGNRVRSFHFSRASQTREQMEL